MQDPEDCGLWQCGSSKLIWETAVDNCEVYFIWTEMPRNIFDFLCGNKLRISPIPQILCNHWDPCEQQLEMIMGMVKEASESIRACALGRSVGGRNVKGSAFALTIDQRPSGIVVSTEKGPELCAFVLLVSACSHQHARERRVTQRCASPGKPQQPPSLWASVEELATSCFQHGASLGTGLHPYLSWAAPRASWQRLKSWENLLSKILPWRSLGHDYKSAKGLGKSHPELCGSSACSWWWLRKVILRLLHAHL